MRFFSTYYDVIMQGFVWVGVALVISIILYLILRSPFHYPYFIYYFNVSGKRKPDVNDLIDKYLNQNNFKMIKKHNKEIEQWKNECQEKLDRCVLKKYRTKQYQKAIDDKEAYIFHLTREQTRYTQKNYIKTSYKVEQIVDTFKCDYNYLVNRNEQLKTINNECTLKEYNSKSQRKLMNNELRRQIIDRDNYTCQICGKYMPDEIGLQVDHIIPISKGGKTIPSNLQVLCSKCNGSKSNRY